MRGVNVMPKMKSCSGAAKRFKKTANGFKHRQSFTSHILTKKATDRKRRLTQSTLVHPADVKSIKEQLVL